MVPDYQWWNGTVTYLTVEDEIDPTGVVTMTQFGANAGRREDHPFKQFTGVQPYDAGNNTMVDPEPLPQ